MLGVGLVLGLYFLLALLASVQQAVRYREFRHLVVLPMTFLMYHLSYGLGILWGLLRLLFRVSPVQRIKEPWPGFGRFRFAIKRLITQRGCRS